MNRRNPTRTSLDRFNDRYYPLAMHPDERPVWPEDLDYCPSERLKVLMGYLVATSVVLGFVCLMALAGGGPS